MESDRRCSLSDKPCWPPVRRLVGAPIFKPGFNTQMLKLGLSGTRDLHRCDVITLAQSLARRDCNILLSICALNRIIAHNVHFVLQHTFSVLSKMEKRLKIVLYKQRLTTCLELLLLYALGWSHVSHLYIHSVVLRVGSLHRAVWTFHSALVLRSYWHQ